MLDVEGVIRAVTPEAAEMLGRPMEVLQGLAFGLIPVNGLRVHMELLTPDGTRKEITARALPESSSPEANVVLLELRPRGAFLADACSSALLGVMDRLRVRNQGLLVGPWPALPAPDWLGQTLSDVVSHLSLRCGRNRLLVINAAMADSAYIVIELQATGAPPAEGEDLLAGFGEILTKVEEAGGFLSASPIGPTPSMRLIVPLSQAPDPSVPC